MSKVVIEYPGTCGELFQGIVDDIPCLVSCPIDKKVRLEISLERGPSMMLIPAGMEKTRKSLERAAGVFDLRYFFITVRKLEALPEGRGYASSTADILGALYGLAKLSGYSLTPEEASSIALSVEPTDSLAWPGLAILDHRKGRMMRALGHCPAMDVLVIDRGGAVDTEEFNRRNIMTGLRRQAGLYEEARSMLLRGISDGDISLVGKASTMSAMASSPFLPVDGLGEILDIGRSFGSPGICRAHSGTLVGVLLDPSVEECGGLVEALGNILPGETTFARHRIVSGGPVFPEEVI